MATVPLPERPRLEQLRKRARELQRGGRTGDPEALRLLGLDSPVPELRLTDAQRVLARTYGFASWTRLKAHVEQIEARTWALPPAGPDGSAEWFLRTVCVTYSGSTPAPDDVRQAVAQAGGLAATEPAVALALADVDAVRAHLTRGLDVDAGTGPFGWPPLMYVTYSRVDAGEEATLATARTLLDAGADPDAGRYVLGYPTPFTALTGVFGDGEHGEPAHPHETALARLLLQRDADPNDAQTLYNRMFGASDSFLRVLFEFGLGRGDGGPWRRRLPDLTASPTDLLRGLLAWAVTHDQGGRVALLARHGVDVVGPLPSGPGPLAAGSTPIEAALSTGNRAMADLLRELGADEPSLSPVEVFVGAVLAGDAEAVAGTPVDVLQQAREARPSLAVWAAALPDRATARAAVVLALDSGFDVDALGRSDVPVEQPWQTALHTAVERDDEILVRLLLEHGADPAVEDARHHATARGWAEFFDRPAVAELLPEPVPEPPSEPDPATRPDAPG